MNRIVVVCGQDIGNEVLLEKFSQFLGDYKVFMFPEAYKGATLVADMVTEEQLRNTGQQVWVTRYSHN